MKIFDCFMFYDEEAVLDIRLNSLKNSVDCFVIVESKFYHNGKKRDLKFDINKFPKFKDKIIILSVIDNLIKGGAGQAVQNMNLKFGFKNNEGLLWKNYCYWFYF